MKKRQIMNYLVPALFCLLTINLSGIFLQQGEIKVEKVSGDVYCLTGQGGNIGILKGGKGLLVVDAQYSRNVEAVLAEIGKISDGEIVYLINTHYHGDHTNGNPVIGKGAAVISHEDCRASFLKGLKDGQSPEAAGAPQLTFLREMSLRFDQETVKLIHFGNGHTSGDTVVVFEQAKVIHAGDLFFHGLPPYIDVADGSDTANWIATIRQLAAEYPEYRIIAGHGPTAEMSQWLEFANYLEFVREQVSAAIKAGQSRDQIFDSIDFSKFSNIQDQGEFLSKKNNVEWIYDEMTRK